jgi:hypothetical protein
LLIRGFRKAGKSFFLGYAGEGMPGKASFGVLGDYVARTQICACAKVLQIRFIGRHHSANVETRMLRYYVTWSDVPKGTSTSVSLFLANHIPHIGSFDFFITINNAANNSITLLPSK